jgi:hypothetical protein
MEDLAGEGTTALHRSYEHVADIRTSLGMMFPNQEKLYYICGYMRVAKHDVVCCKQWRLNHDQRKAALVYGPRLVPDARNDVRYPHTTACTSLDHAVCREPEIDQQPVPQGASSYCS